MLSGDDVFKVVWIVTEQFGLSAILATIPGAFAHQISEISHKSKSRLPLYSNGCSGFEDRNQPISFPHLVQFRFFFRRQITKILLIQEVHGAPLVWLGNLKGENLLRTSLLHEEVDKMVED